MKKAIVVAMALLLMGTTSANAMMMGPYDMGPNPRMMHRTQMMPNLPPPPPMQTVTVRHSLPVIYTTHYAPPPPMHISRHRHHSTGAKVAAGVIIGGILGAALMAP